MPWARSAWNWLTGLAWWLTNDWRNPPDCRERLSAAEAYFHHEGYADRSLWQAAQAELAREVRRSDRWQLAACVAIALLVLAGLAHAQSGTLGPQGKYYYSQGGDRAVKVTDGGTDARTVAAARYNLNVPCRHCADSLAANWRLTGSVILPYTILRDTLLYFTDDADTTKKAKFQLSGISTGTTRYFSWPNRSGVIALENGATITGATITNSAIDLSAIRVRDDFFTLKSRSDTLSKATFRIDAGGVHSGRNTIYTFETSPDPDATIPTEESDIEWSGNHLFHHDILMDQGVSSGSINLHWNPLGTSRTFDFPDLDGTGLVHAGAQPVGDKTLYTTNVVNTRDDRFKIKDDGDTTKIVAFQASGITTGTTRTLTVQNASGTIAYTGDAATAHNLLSATHGDALAGSVARGDLIVGNATPKWSRLAVGASGGYLASDGTDAAWTDLAGAVGGFGYLTSGTFNTGTETWQFNANGDGHWPVLHADATGGQFLQAYDDNNLGGTLGLTYSSADAHTQNYQARDGIILVRSDSLNRDGQIASIGTTTFASNPGAGMYQVNFALESTATAVGGTVSLTIAWTDDAGATSTTTSTLPLTGAGRLSAAPLQIYVASGNITYATTVTGLVGTPSYTVRLRLVPLG